MNDLSLDYINTKSPYLVKRADDGDYVFLRWFEESAEPERFTIKTASAVIEGQGIYAAIIVENRNPMAQAIIDDFELTAKMLTENK